MVVMRPSWKFLVFMRLCNGSVIAIDVSRLNRTPEQALKPGPRYTAPTRSRLPPALDNPPSIQIIVARSPQELDAVRILFAEYAVQLGVDLSFQGFNEELASLPGDYAEPRGMLLLALAGGETAGCCALRPIDDVDYSNAVEMKRLFVRQPFRRSGLGRQLAEAALEAAVHMGYTCVLLDTLDDMETARALYQDLGFEEIPPFYHNPLPGAHYLKVDLN
jgi:ribosomal protein S18 acetylase RimI-like enzyme